MANEIRPLESCYAIHDGSLYKCVFYEKDVCTDLETEETMSRVKILKKLPKTEYIFKCLNSNIRKNITDYPKNIQETLSEL